jgi:hypothetical protein
MPNNKPDEKAEAGNLYALLLSGLILWLSFVENSS